MCADYGRSIHYLPFVKKLMPDKRLILIFI